jgi:hypothetical protein
MLRWVSGALALLLLLGVVWLLRGAGAIRSGADLQPVHLRLRAGDRGELALVSHERSVVAVAFRLRFDEAIVSIDAAMPRYASILEGGNAVVLPPRRGPGVLEVPGMAVTGGRGFRPTVPLYRFTVRAVAPGETTVTVEAFTVVDGLSFQQRSADVAPCRVTVRP